MANTTNYNWETPDDTDLVKDGAAAIRTLGNSIDTTTKALNPETTLGDIAYRSSTSNTNTRLPIGSAGQVLTVAAGVPSWASPSDQTPLTTKGDVFTFSTVDARLGVGANGTVLTADSAETTGLKWATPASGSETLLSTTSASGTSTTVSSISGAYKHLRIWIYDIDITTGTSAQLRFRFNGDTAANYPNFYTGSDAVNKADNTIGYLTNDRAHSVTASETSIILDVYHYANTDAYKPFQSCGIYLDHTASAYYAEVSAGGYASTSAIDSFTLLTASAQSFTGTIKIYGVN